MKKLTLMLILIATSCFGYAQVSYRSKPTQSSNYIPPVDLNLMREVNTYKHNSYQQNSNDINNKLLYLYKLFQYLPKTNWDVIVNEYNTIVKLKNNYDLSNYSYYNYFVERIDILEQVMDWAIKNPNTKLPYDFFDHRDKFIYRK